MKLSDTRFIYFQAVQLSISTDFCLYKKVLFQGIQLSRSTVYFFLPIDRTLLDATTLSQNGPGSHDNKEVLCIPQSSSITGTSPSDCLMSYPGHTLGEFYPSAEKQSVYSTALNDWEIVCVGIYIYIYIYIYIV